MASTSIKILLVESESRDSSLMLTLLGESSQPRFETKNVSALSEALKALGEEKFGVILLNLNLKDSEGLQTLTKILTKFSHTPVIVINGADDEALMARMMKSGAQDYWTKAQVGARFMSRSIGLAVERFKSVSPQVSMAEAIKSKNADDLSKKVSDAKIEQRVGGRREKVLVAEDEEEILQIILKRLDKLGFSDVVSVSNGMEAYNTCISKMNQHENFDVIISDWKMPRLSGLEFLTKIRGNIHLKDTPFMMITGMDERDNVKEAAEHKVSEYLVKPFKLEDFDRKIEGLLRSSKKR